MDVYSEIKAKYGFEIPAAYRRMEQDGFFRLPPQGTECDPFNELYLWVPEAEWMRPQEILDYEPPSYQQSGFVPFAFTGGGEPWCWWPAQDPQAVVFLPIGDAGVFDAPHLVGSIYRRFLCYALNVNEQDADEARRYFGLWARRLASHFPARWIETLNDLAQADIVAWQFKRARGQGFLNPPRLEELVARDLAFPRLGATFEWTTD
jgi:hypothetical protein